MTTYRKDSISGRETERCSRSFSSAPSPEGRFKRNRFVLPAQQARL